MSITTSALEALKTTLFHLSESGTEVKVYVRLNFLRIGEIDTLNEKYQARASIEARWVVDYDKLSLNLSTNDQKRLVDGKSISLLNYQQSNWHPQLYIENAIGDLKEQIRYTAKKSRLDDQIYVCEHRDINGLFWEKLELQHFPSDVQDLSISIGSMFYDDRVILFADPNHLSTVNREAFVDQQEWSLYEHVDTQQRFIKEFLFDDYDEDIANLENDEKHSQNQVGDRKRSIITITCHAARRSNYFYWNGYCLVFLITLISFCIFSIPPHFTGNRIQIACTLLLTSITFRWTINRSLPTISYLTSMDKYSILCIFSLVMHAIWHAIIGFLVFSDENGPTVAAKSRLAIVDQYAFLICIAVFVTIHVIFIAWLFLVPLKHRREMRQKDAQYRLSAYEKKIKKIRPFNKNSKGHSDYMSVPVTNTEAT